MLREISQTQKDKYMTLFICQIHRDRKQMVQVRSWGKGWGLKCLVGTVLVSKDGKVSVDGW